MDFLNLREIGWHKTLNSSSFVGCAPRTSLCSCSVGLTIIKSSIFSFVAHRKEFYTNRAFVASWSSLLQLISAQSTIAKVKEYHPCHKTTAPPNHPEIQDYRHDDATRRNNPPADIASHGGLRETPKHEYTYNPHLPPILRFDDSGDADQIPELLEKAKNGLSDDEIKILGDALKDRAPWLEWAGKQEVTSFAVDPVALHIHERVSAKAILRTAGRQDVQRELFADPQQEYHEAVQFYQHDVDWSNRLILGDSLTVMSSLAHREDLAGKVQMIYIDPPYGIKFASNFQPTVFQRDVKDKESDLTREPEQIKAYRDTWTLGVHSYLAYLRDRLIVAKELLTDSGSIFVQISDENVHRVRCLMDEVFGGENFIGEIVFQKTSFKTSDIVQKTFDYLLWFARNAPNLKVRQLFFFKSPGDVAATAYTPCGIIRRTQDSC